MGEWVFGSLHFDQLATDEIQILTLALLSLAAALVGTFLVLKKMTMLANALSHTILPGLVLVFILCGTTSIADLSTGTLLLAAVITAVLTTLATLVFRNLFRLHEDASTGLICTMMVAIGIVLVTLFTRSVHLGVEAVMGNVDALHPNDLKDMALVACLNLIVICPLFSRWRLIAFDSGFAKTQGICIPFFDTLLLFLAALTVVGAFRAVGILLVLSLLIGPVLIARLFTHRLHILIILAFTIGATLSLVGVCLSRHMLSAYQMPLSTAGILSTLIALTYITCSFLRRK